MKITVRSRQTQADMNLLHELVARNGFNPTLNLIADVETERGDFNGAHKLRKVVKEIEAGE